MVVTIQHYNITENGQNTESWRLEETCCHSNSCERLSPKIEVKNSQRVNNNNDNINNNMDCAPSQIFGTISEVDQRGT